MSAAETRPPQWSAAEVLSHIDQAWEAALARNTQGPVFDVDRKVYGAGHGGHGGWLITQDRMVVCGGGHLPCGRVLFPLADVLDEAAADELALTAATAIAAAGRRAA
jgi:hypothetical protein